VGVTSAVDQRNSYAAAAARKSQCNAEHDGPPALAAWRLSTVQRQLCARYKVGGVLRD
jgi:hypothetical protein